MIKQNRTYTATLGVHEMSKSKEELNKIKEEVEAVNEKLQELTDEELEQVNGGAKEALRKNFKQSKKELKL